MSNRLEHEFPVVRWRAALPRGIDHDLVRTAMARGRRGIALSAARALVEFIRCGAYGIAKRAPEHDCRPAAKSGA